MENDTTSEGNSTDIQPSSSQIIDGSVSSTSATTSASAEGIPGWAVALLILFALLLVVGIIATVMFVLVYLRRKRELSLREIGKTTTTTDSTKTPAAQQPKTSISKKPVSSSTSSSDSVTSTKTTRGTPVLPHSRMTIVTAAGKRSATNAVKSKFSDPGKFAFSDLARKSISKSTTIPDSSTWSKTDSLKTVQKFHLLKKRLASAVSKSKTSAKGSHRKEVRHEGSASLSSASPQSSGSSASGKSLPKPPSSVTPSSGSGSSGRASKASSSKAVTCRSAKTNKASPKMSPSSVTKKSSCVIKKTSVPLR